jgi:hypothetical protein
MISETMPLNQWPSEDLIKMASAIEAIAELSKDPHYIEFSQRIVPVIKSALMDVVFEETKTI